MLYDYLQDHDYNNYLQKYLIDDLVNIIFGYLQLLDYQNIFKFLNYRQNYLNYSYNFDLDKLDYYDINLDHSVKNIDIKVNSKNIKNIYYYDDESMDHDYNIDYYYNIQNITIFGLLTNNLYFLIRNTKNKIIQKNDIIDRYGENIFISANLQNMFNLLKSIDLFEDFKRYQKS